MTIDFNDTIVDEDGKGPSNVVQMKRPRGRPKGTGKKASSVSANKPHSLGPVEDRFTTRSIEEIATIIGLRYEFRYDEVLLRTEFREVEDGQPTTDWRPMRDAVQGRVISHARSYAREDGSDNLKSRDCVTDAIQHMADLNTHNPIKAYLEDCLRRFQDQRVKLDPIASLQSCFTLTPGKEHMLVFLARWLLGSVARVYEEKGHQNFMLVLLGDQGWGKSKFAEWLCSGIPDGKSMDLFQEGQIQPENKDHTFRLAKKWIWCVNELDGTTKKRDVAELKDFLTMGIVSDRPAFWKYEFIGKPICSFLGAVNVDRFLKDETGNRRFVPLPMTAAIDFRRYLDEVDVDLLWGQVMMLYQTGVAYGDDHACMAYPHHPTLPDLSSDEKAWQREQNDECYDSDPIEDWLFQWIMVTGDSHDVIPSHDLLMKAKAGEISPSLNDRALQMKIASALRRRSVGSRDCRLTDGHKVKVFSGVAWKFESDRTNLVNLARKLSR